MESPKSSSPPPVAKPRSLSINTVGRPKLHRSSSDAHYDVPDHDEDHGLSSILSDKQLFDTFVQLFAHEGSLTAKHVKRAIEQSGLCLEDPRFVSLRERLEKLGSASLEFDSFREITAPAAQLLSRSLNGALAVGDWPGFTAALDRLFDAVSGHRDGAVASYIPELARVDPELWALCFTSVDGQRHSRGQSKHRFTAQSSGKPISYLLALEQLGSDEVHRYVGREPSGRNFNELCLNHEGIPHNPMINSGAIMTCSLVSRDKNESDRFTDVMDVWRRLTPASSAPGFNNVVYLAERATANRNFCLSYMMQEKKAFQYGRLKQSPPRTWTSESLLRSLELYFMCCSIELNVEAMACVAATLANGGVMPLTGERVFSAEHVKHTLSLMLSCGLYDYSGEWAYRIGLPAKSGVSGILMVVIPGVGGLATYSPRLDVLGNSHRGIEFFKLFCRQFDFHVLSTPDEQRGPRARQSAQHRDMAVALCWAAVRGNLAALKALVASGAHLDATDYDGRSALHLAAAQGHKSIVTYLLAKRVLPDARDRFGLTPLDEAQRAGHTAIAELLTTDRAEKTSGANSAVHTS